MEPETRSDLMRVDDVEADVECLMCARVIGQLFGHRWRRRGDARSARTIANLTTFSENEPGVRPRPVCPSERFQCRHCGGQGYVSDIIVHTAADDLPSDLCVLHPVPTARLGRPPKGCTCQPRRAAA